MLSDIEIGIKHIEPYCKWIIADSHLHHCRVSVAGFITLYL